MNIILTDPASRVHIHGVPSGSAAWVNESAPCVQMNVYKMQRDFADEICDVFFWQETFRDDPRLGLAFKLQDMRIGSNVPSTSVENKDAVKVMESLQAKRPCLSSRAFAILFVH